MVRIYRGQWKNDEKEGKGFFSWGDGSTYNGMWADNMRNGKGTYKYSGGDVYVPVTGKMISRTAKGSINFRTVIATRVTMFRANGPVRVSSHTPDGDKYSGEFKEGMKDGQGTMEWNNGDTVHRSVEE
jgi:hypothetical protein